jgi:RNA polymerase sigma-70 factor (ECF subfamily)
MSGKFEQTNRWQSPKQPMNDFTSETELIAACQQGDRAAFRQLFELHSDRVWTIALHFTGNETAAHDIAQQVFLKLFAALPKFRQEARFATWLYRLVANVCLDEQRKARRWLSFDFWRTNDEAGDEPAGWQAATTHSQEDSFAQLEMSDAIRAAIKELSPPIRMAILLKYFEDLSYEEIATVLNCSMGTVASRMNRGHKALAIKLAHLRNE